MVVVVSSLYLKEGAKARFYFYTIIWTLSVRNGVKGKHVIYPGIGKLTEHLLSSDIKDIIPSDTLQLAMARTTEGVDFFVKGSVLYCSYVFIQNHFLDWDSNND